MPTPRSPGGAATSSLSPVHDSCTSDNALALAWKLRAALAAPIEAGQDMLRIDATIGVACFPKDATTHDELIRAADMAMYEGKKEGGGRVKLFDRNLAHEASERHMLEQALRDAIDHGDFSLAFQPIVSADTGRCEAFEALLRWSHPVRGAISPAVFIPVAEQSGQIGAIGRWVLKEACRAAAAWPGDAPPVTVNVSVEQVQSGTLLADVHDALCQLGAAGASPATGNHRKPVCPGPGACHGRDRGAARHGRAHPDG